jgi:hypothetical protein
VKTPSLAFASPLAYGQQGTSGGVLYASLSGKGTNVETA